MRKTKSYAVIGLGKFGMSLAETLAKANNDVLVVDDKEDNIQEIQDLVTYAVKADVTEPGAMEALGLSNVDVAVIGISENMEASITATILAKDAGVPFVMAKAMNKLHGRILERVGADKVVYPEYSTGVRVAKNLMTGGFLDFFELSPDFSIVEFQVPEEWTGRSLSQIGIRERYHLNVIGLKRAGKVDVNLDPYDPFQEEDTVIVVGNNHDLDRIMEDRD